MDTTWIKLCLITAIALSLNAIISPGASGARPASPGVAGGFTAEYLDGRGHSLTFPVKGAAGIGALPTTSALWAACGISTEDSKLVRAFRAGSVPLLPIYFRTVNLRCGNADRNNGYRHILRKHKGEWEALAFIVGQDWRSFTDWAIEQSVRHPYIACINVSGNTVNYLGWIQIKNTKGQVMATYYPRVPTGKTTYDVITAFPQSSPNAGC